MNSLFTAPPKDRRARTLPWLVLGLGLAASVAAAWFTDRRVASQERERFEDAVQLERQTIVAVLDQRQRFMDSLVSFAQLAGPLSTKVPEEFTAATNWRRWPPEVLEVGFLAAPGSGSNPDNTPVPKLRITREAGPQAGTAPLPGGTNTLELLASAGSNRGGVVSGDEFKAGPEETNRVMVMTGWSLAGRPGTPDGLIYAIMDADHFYRGLPASHGRALANARFLSAHPNRSVEKAAPGALIPAEPGQREPAMERADDAWLRCYSFSCFGRRWAFAFRPTPDFYATSQAHLPWLALGVGSVISLLLAASAWTQSTSQAHIEQLNAGLEQRIQERTAALAAANERLTRSIEQEKEFARLKSMFVSMVSHEFRTPLGNIQSSAELLHNYFERLAPARREELLRSIIAGTRNMAGIMDAVLVLGRVDSVSYQCQLEPLDLDAFSRRLVEEVRTATNERCPLNFQPGVLPREAQADATLLRHMFTNLLSNAVKYSPAGSPVDFTAACERGAAVFTVRDRGVGIPEADRRRLFEAFQRGSNVGETPGTGLGLVIVKRCVDLHRGTIEIVSADGAGTTVTVRLPVEDRKAGTTFITGNAVPKEPAVTISTS